RRDPSMPLNLAVLAPDRAADVIAAFPAIDQWAVAGHSLGGAMAATFAYDNPSAVDGLALWAAYPPGGNSLADRDDLAVTSIYGTLDGLATVEEIDLSRPLLPASTAFVAIEGGNHAQFGWYGDQAGDNPATISRAEQQAQTVSATMALLDSLGGP
ncbi:MAG: alpha/beta hydrolase, partial [Caldilineaceae bacterium]|nr:alpha/beta hydrolase [Caldilineaceae bacterium]